jgi:hypothetical protein
MSAFPAKMENHFAGEFLYLFHPCRSSDFKCSPYLSEQSHRFWNKLFTCNICLLLLCDGIHANLVKTRELDNMEILRMCFH